MDAWITAAMGSATALVGVGLGYVGSVRITRQEREAAQREAVRLALARYLGVLYSLVSELRAMPDAEIGIVGEALDRLRGESATYVTSRRRVTRTFGSRPFDLQDRFSEAAAQLQVLKLPPQVETAFKAANEYVERLAERRTPELKAQWPRLFEQLHQAAGSIDEM